MGLFKSRAQKKAEAEQKKAVEHQKKLEAQAMIAKAELAARLDAQAAKKQFRKSRRQERKLARKARSAQIKSEKLAAKTAAETNKTNLQVAQLNAQAAADGTLLNTKRVKRYLSVAKLVSPVLVPVAYRAATAARQQLDTFQANRSGLAASDVAQYDGYGARLSARIARTDASLTTLTESNPDAETAAFVNAMRGRLTNLREAVQSAETMPAPRRRAAHQAIGRELAAIDADLLARRGVRA